MPATLTLSHLAVSFGAHHLFHGLTQTIGPGTTLGIVGRNGAGKSTLLRAIAGQLTPEAGTIAFSPATATIGYLPQEAPRTAETLREFVRRRTGIGPAELAMERAAEFFADDDGTSYTLALDQWLSLGGGELDNKLPAVCARIGLDVELDRPLGSLSGGQAARACLASILCSHFDVLLLDEPTNNLDAAGLALMSEFIRRQDSPVLIASHDRALLDEVATEILELDIVQQKVTRYAGGWSDYVEAKALARSHEWEAYEEYQEKKGALEAEAAARKEWSGKALRSDKIRKEPSRALQFAYTQRAEKQAGKGARARAAAERLEVVEAPRKEWQLQYSIEEAGPSASVVATLSEAVVRRGDFVLGPVSLAVDAGDRIALSGPNGSGKSTLLGTLLGWLPLDAGRRSMGTRVHVGVIDQGRSVISGGEPLIDLVVRELSRDAGEARTLLAKFQLGTEHIGRPCDSLSMGERTRAALAIMQARPTNVLVLDEPTNHLDVEAIEQLEQALTSYTGTLILVTHDRQLLESVELTQHWTMSQEERDLNDSLIHAHLDIEGSA